MRTVADVRSAKRVALLRGINLGQDRRLPMADLREVASGLGWSEVATHLQSGNLLFCAHGSADEVAAELSAALERACGLRVGVVVRTGPELQALIAAHPYADQDPARAVIVCCDRPVGELAPRRMAELAEGGERVEIAESGTDIYAEFPNGQAGSKLAAGLVNALRPVMATARNLRTMSKLAQLVGQ